MPLPPQETTQTDSPPRTHLDFKFPFPFQSELRLAIAQLMTAEARYDQLQKRQKAIEARLGGGTTATPNGGFQVVIVLCLEFVLFAA